MGPPSIKQSHALALEFADLLAAHRYAHGNITSRRGGDKVETGGLADTQSQRVVDVASLNWRQIENAADQQQRDWAVAVLDPLDAGIGGNQAGGEIGAGGMPRYGDPLRVAAELCGVAADPVITPAHSAPHFPPRPS